jgi:hypothetical protein
MPVTSDTANLKQRRRSGADLDQKKRSDHDQQGHNRVDHDAQLAVFGIGADGMHMRHLNHGQKRQQDQAHGYHTHLREVRAAIPAGLCPFACQKYHLKKYYTEQDTRESSMFAVAHKDCIKSS